MRECIGEIWDRVVLPVHPCYNEFIAAKYISYGASPYEQQGIKVAEGTRLH